MWVYQLDGIVWICDFLVLLFQHFLQRNNMKIYIPLLLLIILTLSFSSCSKKDDSTAATASDPAAITGETMTIGSIDYTSSL